MPAVAKLCAVCGDDVAAKKRVKDQEGRYYCEPCFNAKRAEHAKPRGPEVSLASTAPAKPKAAVAAAPVADREAPPAPADDGLLDLAPEVKPKSDEPMFGCAGCKKVVPQRQVRNIDGEFLCTSCVAKRNAPQRPASRVSAKKAADDEGDENVERWWHSLSGGLAVSAGVLVLSFGIMTALDFFTPSKGETPNFLLSMLMGAVQTIFVMFRAGALILSMFIAAKILGGISFGYIGPVLFKSIALCTGISIVDFFIDQSESLFMIGFGFRWAAILVALIVLFGIDAFEAMLLSFVNMAMMWILTIAMAATLLFVVTRGGSGDDEVDWEMDEDVPAQVQPAAPGAGAARPDAKADEGEDKDEE